MQDNLFNWRFLLLKKKDYIFFDENFLMTVASIGALITQHFVEAAAFWKQKDESEPERGTHVSTHTHGCNGDWAEGAKESHVFEHISVPPSPSCRDHPSGGL